MDNRDLRAKFMTGVADALDWIKANRVFSAVVALIVFVAVVASE